MGTIHEIVFDCDKPATLARFWCEMLERLRYPRL